MDKAKFLSKYGNVVEDSPWVAEDVYKTGVEEILSNGSAKNLSKRFRTVFLNASPDLQLATLRAHPQLVCALADAVELTDDSAIEQSLAGLDQCSEVELAAFERLNAAYLEKFGFPFIIAVRGRTRTKILQLFSMRLQNDAVMEYQTALRQVCAIARLRIRAIFNA